jgi:CHASE2 domain-containing sensor protein
MAVQTARDGSLRSPPAWAYLLLLAVWSAVLAASFSLRSWRRNLLVVAGCLVLICAVSLYAYAAQRLIIEGLPPALAAFLDHMALFGLGFSFGGFILGLSSSSSVRD